MLGSFLTQQLREQLADPTPLRQFEEAFRVNAEHSARLEKLGTPIQIGCFILDRCSLNSSDKAVPLGHLWFQSHVLFIHLFNRRPVLHLVKPFPAKERQQLNTAALQSFSAVCEGTRLLLDQVTEGTLSIQLAGEGALKTYTAIGAPLVLNVALMHCDCCVSQHCLVYLKISKSVDGGYHFCVRCNQEVTLVPDWMHG